MNNLQNPAEGQKLDPSEASIRLNRESIESEHSTSVEELGHWDWPEDDEVEDLL